ncbi:unnamed protein product [Vicia faba]|uniref:Uncharacterized protein n=1 Tax=Vicia faba TaxID=3906 RepID=A0AAV1AMU5_VICFA|nr:unnamed protein product [Vicia faba]
MADNTRMKEIYAELKKNADAIDLVSTSMTSQIERLEVAGHAQMTRMEEFQQANAAQFSQLNTTLAHLLQRLQTSPHGVANSSVKEPQRNAFQFTALANRVDGLSAEAILDCFISGLNNEISRDVKAMEPRTLTKAVA